MQLENLTKWSWLSPNIPLSNSYHFYAHQLVKGDTINQTNRRKVYEKLGLFEEMLAFDEVKAASF